MLQGGFWPNSKQGCLSPDTGNITLTYCERSVTSKKPESWKSKGQSCKIAMYYVRHSQKSYSLPCSNHQRLLISTKENHVSVNDLTGFVIQLA